MSDVGPCGQAFLYSRVVLGWLGGLTAAIQRQAAEQRRVNFWAVGRLHVRCR
eukprot:COSAG02_NODE_509_length_20882_cov_71.811914_19_plen_52_part_00